MIIEFIFIISSSLNMSCKAVSYSEIDDYAINFGRTKNGYYIDNMIQYKGSKLATTTNGSVIGTFKTKKACEKAFKRVRGE